MTKSEPVKISIVKKDSLNIENRDDELLSLIDLIKMHLKPGSVLEPSIDLPQIVFSEDIQTAVKTISVSVCSAVTETEEYYHSMITELRKN